MGRLVELPYVESLSVAPEGQYSVDTTAEGRVRAQVRPALGRRVWTLSVKHYRPHEQASLMAFVNGEWGPGPFVFIPTDAPVTNMLSPGAASCDPAEVILGTGAILTGTPPMKLPDGSWAGRSYAKNTVNSVFFGGPVPVLPGVKVTASAFVTGAGGAVRIYWYGPGGTTDQLGSVESNIKSTTTTTVRSYVTATPPAGAVSCRVATNFTATQACRPAATWTDTLFTPSDGQGCSKAVLTEVSRDVVKALNNPRTGRWSDLSFTVQEVG